MKFNIQLITDDGDVLVQDSWSSLESAQATLRHYKDLMDKQVCVVECKKCWERIDDDELEDFDFSSEKIFDEFLSEVIFLSYHKDCAKDLAQSIREDEATGN